MLAFAPFTDNGLDSFFHLWHIEPDVLKLELVWTPPHMNWEPENSEAFLHRLDFWLPCITELHTVFLDATADCVKWQLFKVVHSYVAMLMMEALRFLKQCHLRARRSHLFKIQDLIFKKMLCLVQQGFHTFGLYVLNLYCRWRIKIYILVSFSILCWEIFFLNWWTVLFGTKWWVFSYEDWAFAGWSFYTLRCFQ